MNKLKGALKLYNEVTTVLVDDIVTYTLQECDKVYLIVVKLNKEHPNDDVEYCIINKICTSWEEACGIHSLVGKFIDHPYRSSKQVQVRDIPPWALTDKLNLTWVVTSTSNLMWIRMGPRFSFPVKNNPSNLYQVTFSRKHKGWP